VSTVRQKKRTDRTERNTERSEKQEDKGRSNSRNWRERGDDKSSTSAADKDKDKDTASKKDAAPSTASSSKAATPRASAAPTPTKSAWAATGPASPPAPSSATVESTPVPADKPAEKPTDKAAEPAANGSGSSGHSHKPSGDKVLTKADEEDNWRRKEPAPTPAPPPAPAPPAKAAPPPSVNAWDLRKKQQPVPSASTSKEPTPAQAAANKAATPAQPAAVAEASTAAATQPAESKDTKPSGKKPKKKGADAHSGDATAWPDVSQAADTKSEDKKGKHSKQASESTIDDGPSALSGKKQKWTKMAPAELQEAADKVAAELSRRQAKQKQRLRDGGDEPVKKNVNKQRAQEKMAAQRPPRAQRSGSHGSSSVPPHAIANGRLAPGSAASEASDAPNGDQHAGANGSASAPLSRHGSNQGTSGKRPSPHSGSTPLSPESGAAPLPHHFGGNVPRRGRDRDGRGGYGGRGRGGYRSASNTPMNRMYELSPVGQNASLYGSYGVGYGYYPVPANMTANMVAVSGGFDPAMAAQYSLFQRGMPPPPLPVTAVPNIDPLRYWVLGQVSLRADDLS
jgi:la-related protein 1